MEYQRRNGYVLVLRTCTADMMSHGGFVWPESGFVEAPDWDPEPTCGKGLHGLLWGEGDGLLLFWEDDAKWLVCEVAEDQIVDLVEKVKFPKAEVIYCGDRQTATDLIYRVRPGLVVGATVTAGNYGIATAGGGGKATAGDDGTAIAGYDGIATAGDGGTATVGNYGTATAGVGGTATAGVCGTAKAGYNGTATAGYHGTAIAGDDGTATAGNWGKATAGDGGTAKAEINGTAIAGDYGTATAGDCGTATAGEGGTAMAGEYGTTMAGINGIIQISCFFKGRKRIVIGYIGEDGLLPDTTYKLDAAGRFVKAE